MTFLNWLDPDDRRALICAGCARTWRPDEDVSPGEADGICRDCYETEIPHDAA